MGCSPENPAEATPRPASGTGCGELLFLVGYRGSGKTTVAQHLAQLLHWDWVDADALLEAQEGRSIRQIFAEEGEASFRDKEAALLEMLCQRQRQVIATGGGVVLRPENRQRLRTAGYVVWLAADADTLWERLCQDASTFQRRPDLTIGGRKEVEQLLRLREPLYAAVADLTINTVGRTPAEIAVEIAAAWTAACRTSLP